MEFGWIDTSLAGVLVDGPSFGRVRARGCYQEGQYRVYRAWYKYKVVILFLYNAE